MPYTVWTVKGELEARLQLPLLRNNAPFNDAGVIESEPQTIQIYGRESHIQETPPTSHEEHVQTAHSKGPQQQRKRRDTGIANVPEGKT